MVRAKYAVISMDDFARAARAEDGVLVLDGEHEDVSALLKQLENAKPRG